MKEEIRQDGRAILSSEDGFSIRMFFNNLSGKNFSGKEVPGLCQKHSLRRNGLQAGYNRTLLRREESQDRHTSRTLNSSQDVKVKFCEDNLQTGSRIGSG